MAHDTSVHDDQMLLQLPSDSSSDSSNSTVEESILSEYSNWPAGDENDDKAAKKIYTCLQGKIDHHSRGYGRFQKTPASELPILFEINGQIISTQHALQTTTSPLVTLPKDVMFITVLLLDDVDIACLACTCKDLASTSHSFAIVNTREYFSFRGHLNPRTDMCSGCHKNRPTTAKFWHDKMEVIIVWLNLLDNQDEDTEHPFSELCDDWIKDWTNQGANVQKEIAERQQREISGGDNDDDNASENANNLSMKVMKLACERRAVIKCPSCGVQDHDEMKRLGLYLRRHEVDHPLDEKARRLASSTQDRFWFEDEMDEDWKRVRSAADNPEGGAKEKDSR